jgi:hypothetical protein
MANGGVKLNGDAHSFKPGNGNGKTAPIAWLNRGSEAMTEPLIVGPDAAKTNKMNGAKLTINTQLPIGTRSGNASPVARIYFTTDIGPDVKSPGGHYLKISVRLNSTKDLESVLHDLHLGVSVPRTSHLSSRSIANPHRSWHGTRRLEAALLYRQPMAKSSPSSSASTTSATPRLPRRKPSW